MVAGGAGGLAAGARAAELRGALVREAVATSTSTAAGSMAWAEILASADIIFHADHVAGARRPTVAEGRIDVYAAPMETIATLVAKLLQPGLDMFDERRHRDAVARQGCEAVRELLPLITTHPSLVESLLLETLRGFSGPADRESAREALESQLGSTVDPVARRTCMGLLADQYPEVTHPSALTVSLGSFV